MTNVKHLIFCFLLCFPNMVNARTIEQVFLSMPKELCPLLSVQQRHEMLEYAKVGQTDSVINMLGGQTEIRTFDTQQNYLNLAYNSNANLELKLLYLPQSTDSLCVIGNILTVCAPICSSVIRFYDIEWHPIHIPLPSLQASHFINTDDEQTRENLVRLLPPTFVRAEFDEHNNIIFSNETIKTLSQNEQECYSAHLQTYKWTLWKK